MGNVRWKANEIEFLKENYGVLKLEEIANAVNKTVLAVKRKAERDERQKIAKPPMLQIIVCYSLNRMKSVGYI